MIKKVGMIIFVLFAFMILVESVTAVGDVAYIYRKAYAIDQNVMDAFDEAGLSVDLINEASLPINFAPYKMIYAGDENFRKQNLIKVNDYPSIVANFYHDDYWGYTDGEGASQLVSSQPLRVRKNNQLIQVYTLASEGIGGPSLPYYFLDQENIAPSLESVAKTETTSSGDNFGDVIATAGPGDQLFGGRVQNAKMCFFGIIKSDYWTPQAKQMFMDCISYVVSECSQNSDCGQTQTTGLPFCYDGDVYQTQVTPMCLNGGVTHQCDFPESDILIQDCPFGCANGVCLNPVCSNDGDCNDNNSSTQDTCNMPGTINAYCSNDPIECFTKTDCGSDGPVGSVMCSVDGMSVEQDYKVYSCNNPGTSNSYCSDVTTTQTVDQCSATEICTGGQCVGVACSNDEDCNDSDMYTYDKCNNPGQTNSFCTNDPIRCFTNPDCNDNNSSTQDTCNMPGTVDSFCTNGQIACFTKADCGSDGPVGSVMCSVDGMSVEQDYKVYSCINGGTSQSMCDSEIIVQTVDQCSSDEICASGQCFPQVCEIDSDCNDQNPLTLDECINPGTVLNDCRNTPINCGSDADCGYTGFIGGEYCGMNGNVVKNYKTSTCVNPGAGDSFCSINTVPQEIQQCSGLCSAGECVPEECSVNSDCDDSNPLTIDECINPGTVLNDCRNTPINCASNNDCGYSGFIGSEFCSAGDSISKNEQLAVCVNAGASNSYCDIGVGPQQIDQCDYACYEGGCIRCDANVDCNDNNPNTHDLCFNAGTANSYCQNDNDPNPVIECSVDSDCPGDVPLTGEFCSIEGVSQILMTYTCINPGQPVSYCQSNIEKKLLEQCDNFCLSAMCVDIECFIDSDCNDSNTTTTDICHNPATPQSYCENVPMIECYTNSDCDDSDMYTLDTCHLPGTVNSFCTNDPIECFTDLDCDDSDAYTDDVCILPGTVNSYCENNPIECIQDSDCDDSNGGTIDSCNLPGTPNSYCTNDPVSCFDDVDCPDIGLSGPLFCSGDDIFQEYLSGMCVHPGMSNSMCEQTGSNQLVQECPYACYSGQCIRCDENSDCNDNNALTTDTCLMPGTLASSCENNFTGSCVPGTTMACGSSDVGQCQLGVKTCGSNGEYGSCVGAIGPSTEICDNLDNDCDGSIDEGNVCAPTCSDECNAVGTTQCVDSSGFRICGNFDNDSCLEWSSPNQCGFGFSCSGNQCVSTP